jgi:hypothetical protein
MKRFDFKLHLFRYITDLETEKEMDKELEEELEDTQQNYKASNEVTDPDELPFTTNLYSRKKEQQRADKSEFAHRMVGLCTLNQVDP